MMKDFVLFQATKTKTMAHGDQVPRLHQLGDFALGRLVTAVVSFMQRTVVKTRFQVNKLNNYSPHFPEVDPTKSVNNGSFDQN